MNFDFDPKDFPGFTDISEITSRLVDEKAKLIERCLVGAVEQIEGRVPTNHEVALHGERKVFPDGREWFVWRGQPIMEIPAEPMKFENGKITFTLRTVFREQM